MYDKLEHFYFPRANARGSAIRLQEAWQAILKRRDYPQAVQKLLGEMTAGAAMIAGSITFPGSVLLQLMGDGPVRLAMVEVKPDLGIRAVARLDEKTGGIPDDATLSDLVNVHGKARCAITLVQPDPTLRTQSYQGIVDIAGSKSVAEALSAYMTHSEQVETRMWLASDAVAASGIMLQKVAGEGGKGTAADYDPEDWNRVQKLAETVTPEELLKLEPRELLTRLFWEENPRMAEPREPKFECGCSRERVSGMIRALGEREALELVAERGSIDVTCEFCGKTYSFDPIDVRALFESRTPSGTETRH
ncbi:MAG: Hsp33 family molecular chaperone HslO [Sutterellaceae bacterium]|nr:Hsp33 family molecular chaperone HslO [Sutterellaceae bacterium]MDD7442729.1 Hsp33 family molecular chaperone HslO [Sutterellaceae bacterium]MDY2867311.1 Hsp33 family molecular chaperone HslO [Mesosutterella sp.]